MTSAARKRLNEINKVASERDEYYNARYWLKDHFYGLVEEALIDGKTSVTIVDFSPSVINRPKKELLERLGYTVVETTRYTMTGGETTTTISWQNE